LKRTGILTVYLLVLLLPACEDEVICTRELVARTGAGFYVRDAAGERDTTLGNLTFYALQRPDSLLYNAASSSSIKFPLPEYPGEVTAFILGTATGTDTFRVFYSTRLELVSWSCGYTAVHELERLEYGHHVVDTIVLDDPVVDLTDDENLKIYVWPAVADTAAPDTAVVAAGMVRAGSAF
jgi:hypothetical protein